ncbi:MAG: transporter [Desulfobacterales bacterium GWB2_56_26]|nr:MAG: transporter [Desulfobacterales bacterium GWB2_56_26]
MNLKTSRYLTVVLCALVLVLTNCQQDGPAEKAGKKVDQTVEAAGKKMETVGATMSNKVESAAASLDDAAITARIKAGIVGDSLLKVAEIDVVTTNGVVKLNGTVSSQKSVDRAQEIASGVKDVKSVENGLKIKSY